MVFLNPKHNENILPLYKKTKKFTTTYQYRDEGEMRGRVEGRRELGRWGRKGEGLGCRRKGE